jgi:hypothetical protein
MSAALVRTRWLAAVVITGLAGAAASAQAAVRAGDRARYVTSVGFTYVEHSGQSAHAAGPIHAPATVTVRDSTGRIVSRHPAAPATVHVGSPRQAVAAANQIGCRFNWLRRGFRAYGPLYFDSPKSKAYYYNYVYFRYMQRNARSLSGSHGRYYTKQYEDCTTGGGHSKGGNRLTRAVTGMSRTGATSIVKWAWGTKAHSGVVKASLTFEVKAGPVTISGTDYIHDQDTLDGSLGGDKDLDFTNISHNNENNQVDSFWESPDTFIWDGSTHFEGNVGQGLWEYPMSAHAGTFAYGGNVAWICGHAFGIGCA